MEAEKPEAELEESCSDLGREILGIKKDQDCGLGWSGTAITDLFGGLDAW